MPVWLIARCRKGNDMEEYAAVFKNLKTGEISLQIIQAVNWESLDMKIWDIMRREREHDVSETIEPISIQKLNRI